MGATRVAGEARARIEVPVPREHGAWVMLSLPLVLGAATGPRGVSGAIGLLVVTTLAVFLAQDLIRRRVRGRLPAGAMRWLAGYAAAAVAAGFGLLALLPPAGRVGLVVLGGVGGAIFAVLLWALARPGGKRFDRSVVGELLAVPALTLTGPAAAVVATGELGAGAWTVWALSVAYFGSGMLFVKMLLDGWKRGRRGLGVRTAPLAVGTVAWHSLVLAGLVAVSLIGLDGAWPWLPLAYLPCVARAAWGFARLGRPLPRLVAVGVSEAVLAVVFVSVAAAVI